MKYFEGSSDIHYTWTQVAVGFWRRYPNPNSTHVLSEDVIARRVSHDGCLHTKRLLTKTNKLPKWGERFVPSHKQVFVLEESVVDPRNKTLTTYTRNLGLTSIMSVVEKCVYSATDNGNSVCHKQAWISSSLVGFGRALQHFGYERFKRNATKASKGFEIVLAKLYPVPDNTVAQTSKLSNSKDKIKESAMKAKTMAKNKAASVIATN